MTDTPQIQPQPGTPEKSHVKTLFSHTVYYGIGLFLNRSLSVLLLPLYTSYFSPQDLGVYSLIFSLWVFLNILYVYGTETSFLKFFIDAKDIRDKSSIYCTSLVMITVSSLVFSLLLYYFSYKIALLINFSNFIQAGKLIEILAVLIFFDALSRYPLLLLRAELKAKTYAIITAGALVINLTLNIILITGYHYGLESIFYAYTASVIFTLIAGLIVTRGYLKPPVSFAMMKQLVSYGNKFIYIGVLVILVSQSDRYFLKYFFDESVVGIYSANYRLASVMSLAIASFKFAWTPYFLNLAENPESKKVISNVFTYFAFVALAIFLFFSLFTEPLARISIFGFHILGEEYWGGLGILPLILGAYFFLGMADNLNAAPFLKNKTSLLLLACAVSFVVNIGLNFWLTPVHGMFGAAWSILLTYLVQFIALYFISQKIFPVPYRMGRVLAVLSLVLICYAAGIMVNSLGDLSTAATFIINGSLFLLFLGTVHFAGILDLGKIRMLFTRK